MNWYEYFLSLLNPIASKSKDPHTKIGCVIVGPNKEIRTTGYNSFVRGLNDNVQERYERPEKYFWIEHAERNAIYNAARNGIPLEGCSIYIAGIPCIECCRAIISCGIKEIIVSKESVEKWKERKVKTYEQDTPRVYQMLEECSVRMIVV